MLFIYRTQRILRYQPKGNITIRLLVKVMKITNLSPIIYITPVLQSRCQVFTHGTCMYAATHPAMTIKLDPYDEFKFLVALNLLSDCLQKSLAFLSKMHDKELIH